jgi:hypothetical protein
VNLAERAARDLVALAGPRVAHVTMAANLDTIRSRGLKCARDLCVEAGVAPSSIAMRRDRRRVSCAVLNHQLPIVQGLAAAQCVLDPGLDPATWAEMLDGRVFFFPSVRLARFAASMGREGRHAILWLDTMRLALLCHDRIDLAPINSGNFRQGGARARRGDWLYVPLGAGAEAFRRNRQERGLVARPDRLMEISLRGSLSAQDLAAVLAAPPA